MPKPKIRNCSIGKKCSQKWKHLTETEDPDLRYCEECDKGVHYCNSPEELTMHIMEDHCVAISREVLYMLRPAKTFGLEGNFVGEPSPRILYETGARDDVE
ncbi:hypothetical protein FE810_13765 [Thalassotalea litorea]|uniref:Uncharacterized protein n=1 Tax=Thalassotalea litorea TaxID=2020715 RepID=A0A5R9II88_9GAMM|nr:hypothetical protein [Thalassotalea litorea]TLU61878.1 hypothetical protein FE810_13765 [Thalassotalea litorea]